MGDFVAWLLLLRMVLFAHLFLSVVTDNLRCLSFFRCFSILTVFFHCTMVFLSWSCRFKLCFPFSCVSRRGVPFYCRFFTFDFFRLGFRCFRLLILTFLGTVRLPLRLRAFFVFRFSPDGFTLCSGCAVGFSFALMVFCCVCVLPLAFLFVLPVFHCVNIVQLDFMRVGGFRRECCVLFH